MALNSWCYQLKRTTYGTMNDWMRLQGKTQATKVPVQYAGMDGFKNVPMFEGDEPVHATIDDYDDKFKKSYSELASQIAYRYPNPGLPRFRQGAIGGTWRHIKEVLGHHGSRVCFVDGLVSVYDSERFTEELHPIKSQQPSFVPTQEEYSNGRRSVILPKLDNDWNKKCPMTTPRAPGPYQFK